jgi:pyruvate-formate lyase-activating enzyme
MSSTITRLQMNEDLKNSAKRAPERFVTALVADRKGKIFELDGYAAVGMAGEELVPLTTKQTVEMPQGSELMLLPERRPIVFNLDSGELEILRQNPFAPAEPLYPVAAFNSPGYVVSRISAYDETSGAAPLPLFSYGAVGWAGEGFRSAVILVDPEPRQDLRQMKLDKVVAGVEEMRRRLPGNRLRSHLEKCALTYGCPAGKNFFLGRYEAPLPTARQCNAHCLGCLSLQPSGKIHHSQDRIAFTPTPEEIAAVALTHIERVPRAVVSFGQGCEGDPLLAAEVIEPAVRLIRSRTDRGTINMNTNGSLPAVLERLFDAGLDSMRISLNSVRKNCYEAYFRPGGYRFEDVLAGIDLALGRGIFTAINYLNIPGFTDTPEECAALEEFLANHPISMIQWRNLNYDPMRYWQVMNQAASHGHPMGMGKLLECIRNGFPEVRFGYFNPPKESYRTAGDTD